MYRTSATTGRISSSFPRTRGDVPRSTLASATSSRLPPHARGCTRCLLSGRARSIASPARAGMYRLRGQRRERRHASPARAGMYPSRPLRAPARASFPRTRGDVPYVESIRYWAKGLPPHARGCTAVSGQAARGRAASPARAGMYPIVGSMLILTQRFPRTRGDVPQPGASGWRSTRLPPHARGCTAAPRAAGRTFGASPARAGMYPAAVAEPVVPPGFPRTRGDVPSRMAASWRVSTLPPHARGCTPGCAGHLDKLSASPARAGMYPL